MKSLDRLCEREGLPDSLQGNLIDNRYKIRHSLGQGGFGYVYLAEHEILGHPIRNTAFKLLKQPDLMREEVADRFSDVIAVARLFEINAGHEYLRHIVHIYDAGICENWSNRGYVVMECVAGDLQKELGKSRSLPVGLAINYARQICRAMVLAHQMDPPVLHRDLKPPNVLIDNSGAAKVTDFGLAKAVGSITGLAEGAGDFFCQAPESLAGACSQASDVYSIGLILYEMLTGRHPFHDLRKRHTRDMPQEKQIEEHKKAREKKLPDAISLNPELRLHPDLCQTLDRCLSPHPEDRHKNSAELLAELDQVGKAKSRISYGARANRDVEPENTEDIRFLLQQAMACEQRGDHQAAFSFLERILARADQNEDRVYLGEALYLSGKIKAKSGDMKTGHKELFRAYKTFGHSRAGDLIKKLARERRGAAK